MTTHPIVCSAGCGRTLGTVDLPDDIDAGDTARAIAGGLCEFCGAAYAGLVTAGDQPAGQAPTQDQVDTWQAAQP